MAGRLRAWMAACLLACLAQVPAWADTVEEVVDIPTRPGVTQRVLLLIPEQPRAVAVLLPGGHGGLQISPRGSMKWGRGNFLVRSGQLFADAGMAVAIVDAPSDRQAPPFMLGFRETPQHLNDMKTVIAYMRGRIKAPVWLVGTSRGTQSAAYVASRLAAPEGPDGLVLTATLVADGKGAGVAAQQLDRIRVPVLLVHHQDDACPSCRYALVPPLLDRFSGAPRKELVAVEGGLNRGDPCNVFSYHGFNGIERDVVKRIAAWALAG